MNDLNFCYWLKGFFEISRADSLNEVQVQEIKNHIDLVKGGYILQGADLTVYNRNAALTGGQVYIC